MGVLLREGIHYIVSDLKKISLSPNEATAFEIIFTFSQTSLAIF